MFSWYGFQNFLRPFVVIPVAPVSTRTIIHFKFHIRCISIYKILFLAPFPLPFARYFCQCFCHIYQYECFLFFVFNYHIWSICLTSLSVCLSVCIPSIYITVSYLVPHTSLGVCVFMYQFSISSMPRALHFG